MALHRGLYVPLTASGIGTSPLEARLALAGTLAENSPGVPRSGLLRQPTANVVTGVAGAMRYSVGPCHPVVNRSVGDGVYAFAITGSNTVDTTVAPASGSRYDIIWVKQNDTAKNDPDNQPVLGVTHGTPSSSPARPFASVPEGALVLAEALVPAGVTGTTGAGVVITQLWLHTAMRGAPITVRSAAERDNGNASPTAGGLSAYTGLQVVRLDKLGCVQTNQGGQWVGRQMWSGNLAVPAVANGGSYVNDAFTFSNVFSGTPKITVTPPSSRLTASVTAVTSTGFSAVFDNRSGAQSNAGTAVFIALYMLVD